MSGSYLNTPVTMKPRIWFKTSDGFISQVEQNVALFCPLIRQIVPSGLGLSNVCPIDVPIDHIILGVIMDFCYFYHLPGHSDLERKLYNEKFFRTHKTRLREIRASAVCLQLDPLVKLTDDALLKLINGSTHQEIRQASNLPNDITEEDRWKPIPVYTDDPQVRLLNKLGQKKRQEVKDKEKLKNVEVEAPHVDTRSIDELMLFINGENEGPKEIKTCKSKKKKQNGKHKQKTPACVSEKYKCGNNQDGIYWDLREFSKIAVLSCMY